MQSNKLSIKNCHRILPLRKRKFTSVTDDAVPCKRKPQACARLNDTTQDLSAGLESVSKKSRTELKRQLLPQQIFEPRDRRQEDSFPSSTSSAELGNSKRKRINLESSCYTVLPSEFKNGNAPQRFDTSGRHSQVSNFLLSGDRERGNVIRWRSHDRDTGSATTNERPNAKYSNETPPKLIGSGSKFEVGQPSSTSIKGTGYKFLENLLEKDPMEVVVKLASSKIGFIEYLKKEMSPDLILLTLKILAEKVCAVGFQHNKTTVLIAACQPYFLNQLEKQINQIPIEHESRKTKILPFLENLIIFYETVVNLLPQTACEKFKNLFVSTELSIEGAQRFQNLNCADIKKKFECLSTHLKTMIEEKERSSIKQSSKMEQLQYLEPPDNFRYYSIFPTADDFANKPFLRPSIIKGAYIDVEHYLDVQFRLLREDFVGPLREGISQYVEHSLEGQKRFKRIDNVRIYHDAKFENTVTVKERVGVVLNFDTKKKLKNINWEHSKRFMFGSLLCFTNDNFGTFFFGTVLERDKKQLENGCVVVELCDEIDTTIFDGVFTAAESEVYFEPYRQVLNALQTMPVDEFPMKRYIVDGVTEVNLPMYIRRNPDSVKYKIGEFQVPVTEINNWPTAEELKLDISQYKSFRTALTKEFVIIQGPPGTGKTFLGLKIIETFLDNQNLWNTNCRPILVVCYTNHALDQVLEGTLKYTEEIIRIGGQSRSEILGKYNLKEVRRNCSMRISAASSKEIFFEMQEVISHIHSLQEDLEKMTNNNAVISISSLKEIGITDKQLKSFMCEYLVSDEDLIEWLKGDGNEDPGNQFQEDDANACNIGLDYLPRENCDGHDNDDEDDDNNIDVFNDGYGLEIQKVDELRLKYALELSDLQRNIWHYENQMESYGDNIEYYVKYQQLWQYNVHLYRFFKTRLTEVANVDGDFVERLQHVYNPWDLNTKERWCLYRFWCRLLYSNLVKKVWQLQAKYRRLCMRFDEIRDAEDLGLMKRAHVVGMTTTGAARKQPLLQELKPQIVIVEEAAEVLESHVVVSLTKACEHLILIGDHKQLRPSTAVFQLGKKFNFDISLFERMLQNGMHFDCLEVQHRMRPDIANLITPTIYPTLKSAPSVFQYKNVKGITKNLFFITHRFPEEEVSETVSRRNPFEAEFLIALCRYLLFQGYKETEITILTTYSGQMFYMRKLKKESGALQNVQITVVDNFQGEENKIILLSLVRSNEEANIGFLKIENRVCVALSRAKEGFYMIGNMDNLTKSSKIWPKINETLIKQDAVGSHLTLKCEVHPSKETKVASAKDFEAVPEGGCSLPCEAELPCGHKCQSICHVWNRSHEKYKCYFPCERVPKECPLGHKCLKKCFQDCGHCETSVKKVLPCEHVKTLACHVDVTKYLCHEEVEVILEPCKHKTKKLCFLNVENVPCPFPCEDRLPCGHSCLKKCHARDDPDHLEYKCNKPCEKNNSGCKRNHKCNKKCYEDCGECAVKIQVKLSCGHAHTIHCSSDPSDVKCHVKIQVQLNCGHTQRIECSSDPSEVKCGRDCKRTMACGHMCRLLCFQPCGGCLVPVQKIIPDCGHKVRLPCSKEPTRSMCKRTCERLLECGHRCKSLCCHPCTSNCMKLVPSHVTPACGHTIEAPCYLKKTELSPCSNELLSRCKMPCGKTLECGHVCAGTCSGCFQGRLHLPCREKCARVQICGHSCNTDCVKSCPPCNQKCDYQCRHSHCTARCGFPCVPCKKPCAWRCKHLQCTKRCYEICNREPCYEPCEKKRRCGHDCVGFCGEPCPPICRICDAQELKTITFGFDNEACARFVYLEDCKHTIESKALDTWLKQKDDEICLKSCPMCKTPIKRTLRFLNYLKKSYRDISNVKQKVFGNPKEKRIQLTIALKRIDVPCLVNRGSAEIHEMLSLLHSALQPPHNSRIYLSRADLDTLSIKIDFVSKLLGTLKHLELYGDPFRKVMKQFDMLVYLMRTRNANMSQQEVNDFNLEINRFARLAQLGSIETTQNYITSDSDSIEELHKKAVQYLISIERFTSIMDQKVKEILDQMNKKLPFGEVPLDNEIVRRETVKAVGPTPGHWFKCPNGHYYVIGNCGRVTHEGKCPDCEPKIGV